ncbi:Os1348 family NHLP clan protein [Solwaraspora sp. WMMB335]|uniref:Os1348 family NHLP clan protein n=1 Tax=Solwaraspora sp. WMMB335 TaxID=3404118 RepID=UPI003B9240B2
MTTAESVPSEADTNQIKDVLERAIADPEFGRQLLDDPDTALADYVLSEVQLLLLRSLDEEDLVKLTPENLEEFFAVDSAVYTPEDVRMVQQGYEVYDADELDE